MAQPTPTYITDALSYKLTIAGNVSTLVASVVIFIVMLLATTGKIGHISEGGKKLAIGIMYTSGALALHRVYWTIERVLTLNGHEYLAHLFDTYSFVLLSVTVMFIYGYSMHIQTVLKEGDRCKKYFLGGIASIFALTYLLIS